MARAEHRQLTHEVLENVGRKGTRRAWLLALLLLVLMNVAAEPLRHLDGHIVMVEDRWADLLAQPYDWLILGDSSGSLAVVTSQVEDSLGGDAVNLCLFGSMTLLTDAWMLDAHIEKHGPPDGVILVHVYDVTERDIEVGATAWTPQPWGFWSKRTPNYEADARRQFDIFMARYFPLFTNPGVVRKALLSFARLDSLDRVPDNQDGWMPLATPDSAGVAEDLRYHMRFVRKHPYRLSEDSRVALEHIRDLAEAHDFQVYLAHSPLAQTLYDEPDFRAHLARCNEVLDSLCATSPNLHHILAEPVLFPAASMERVDHVTGDAAYTYTAELMKAVKAR